MSDATSNSGPDAEVEVSLRELERVQAERDALAEEVERLKVPRRHRFRRGVVAVLVALSCLLVVLSTTVV